MGICFRAYFPIFATTSHQLQSPLMGARCTCSLSSLQ